MRLGWIVGALVVLNLLLLAANGILLRAVSKLADASSGSAQSESLLRHTAERLQIERARLENRCSRLERLILRLSSELGPKRESSESEPPQKSFDSEAAFSEAALEAGLSRPDPLTMPPMSKEELALLQAKRSALGDLNDGVLLRGDISSILSDPRWNPEKRELSPQKRRALARLVSEYRYFRMISPVERFRNMIQPHLPELRQAGAYIEYPEEEGPPELEGVRISHAEPSETPGYRRLFVFYPEDYPALNHQERVERERSLERFVQIYELMNGPITPSSPGSRTSAGS